MITRGAIAISLLVLSVFTPVHASAHSSSGVACKQASITFDGASGGQQYWTFKVKLVNDRNRRILIAAQFYDGIGNVKTVSRYVSKHSALTAQQTFAFPKSYYVDFYLKRCHAS